MKTEPIDTAPPRQPWTLWRKIRTTWSLFWFAVGLLFAIWVAWRFWRSLVSYVTSYPGYSMTGAVIGLLLLAWGARSLIRRARKKFERGKDLAARISR